MALTLTIGPSSKVPAFPTPSPYTDFVDFNSIVIQNSVQVASDTMEFTLYIQNYSVTIPECGNEVIFKNDDTIEFGGVLTSISRRLGPEPSIQILDCSCRDYVYFLNRRLVNKVYSSAAAGVTIKAILTDLFNSSTSDVHYEFFKDNVANVDNGATLATFRFDKVVPSQAFDMIAQSTGMQWWIDFDKKVYFKNLNEKEALFLSDNTINIEDYIYQNFDFEETESIDGIATQIILRDMTVLSTDTQVDEKTGDEMGKMNGQANKYFQLSRQPFNFLQVLSVTKNTGGTGSDVAQDLEYEDIDGQTPDGTGASDDVFVMVGKEVSYVRFANANTVGNTDVVKVTYKYGIEDDLEQPDFNSANDMGRRTGGDGIHQFIYTQTSGMRFSDPDDAEFVTTLLRERKSKVLRRGSFKSWIGGWQAGQTFLRRWPSSTSVLIEKMHVISVSKRIITPHNQTLNVDGVVGYVTVSDPIIESEITYSNIPYGIAF